MLVWVVFVRESSPGGCYMVAAKHFLTVNTPSNQVIFIVKLYSS